MSEVSPADALFPPPLAISSVFLQWIISLPFILKWNSSPRQGCFQWLIVQSMGDWIIWKRHNDRHEDNPDQKPLWNLFSIQWKSWCCLNGSLLSYQRNTSGVARYSCVFSPKTLGAISSIRDIKYWLTSLNCMCSVRVYCSRFTVTPSCSQLCRVFTAHVKIIHQFM